LKFLDSGFNRNDDSWEILTFYETVNFSIEQVQYIQRGRYRNGSHEKISESRGRDMC
jgi:hypothetical protein